jgi:hypothetical protein
MRRPSSPLSENVCPNLSPVSLTGTPEIPAHWVRAAYHEAEVEMYRGNPYLEALPPLMDGLTILARLSYEPPYDEAHRKLSTEVRAELLQNLLAFVQPLSLHRELASRLGRLIRFGYVGRNPLTPGAVPGFRQTAGQLAGAVAPWAKPTSTRSPTATGMSVIGMSGVGKSTAIAAALGLFPQVILHQTYAGRPFARTQLVYLKLDCPFDGSIKGLTINFFEEVDRLLGTQYLRTYVTSRATALTLLPHMAQVARVHGLGLLGIDEIQHLNEARSGGEKQMLNFFVQLVNDLGVPVLLVGTGKAQRVLGAEFRQARRGTAQGDMVWDRMKEDDEWRFFLETMWRYQYVRHASPLTDEIANTLYQESQGITDVVVKLYFLAQQRAILREEDERITPDHIRSVAADSMRMLKPALDALRTNNEAYLRRLEDVLPSDIGADPADAAAAMESPKKRGERRRNSRADHAATSGVTTGAAADRSQETLARLKGMALHELAFVGQGMRQPPYDTLRAAGFVDRLDWSTTDCLPNALWAA